MKIASHHQQHSLPRKPYMLRSQQINSGIISATRRSSPPNPRHIRYSSHLVIPRSSQNNDIYTTDTDKWENYRLTSRLLNVAVKEENFPLAAQLRDQMKAIADSLPSNKQLLIALAEKLATADSLASKKSIIQSLGVLGDFDAVPVLQPYLPANDQIGELVEAAMWCIFLYPPNEQAKELMEQGVKYMGSTHELREALSVFDILVQVAPFYAEAYNKRATTYYLLAMYPEAIEDCRQTLLLNEYHFGAASGMGICCSAVQDYKGAIQAFSKAIEINPRMKHLQYHIEQLRTLITD